MGVFDGQPVSAAVTNPAFVNKNQDDVDSSKLGLANTAPDSGGFITAIQQEHNSIASFCGKITNTAATALPPWVNNDVGTSIDPLFERIDSITLKFNGASGVGHRHTGAAGDGAPVVTSIRSATGSQITGDITLQGTGGTTITQFGNTISIDASSGGGGGGSSNAIWDPADVVSIINIPVTGSLPLIIDNVLMGSTSIAEIPLSFASASFHLNATSQQKIAQPIVSPVNDTATSATLYLSTPGSPAGNIRVLIFGSVSDYPDLSNVIATSSYIASSSVTASPAAVTFTGFSAPLSMGQRYFISIEGDAAYYAGYTGPNSIFVEGSGTSYPGVPPDWFTYDGTNWVDEGNGCFSFILGFTTTLSQILLAGQSTQADNGIYDYSDNGSTYTLARRSDASVSANFLNGKIVDVTNGSIYGSSIWSLASPNTIILGTSSLFFGIQSGISSVGTTAIINETQPSGSSGGAFNSGAWRTRTLNTIQSQQSWVEMLSSQITLTPGTYLVEASAPCYRVDSNVVQFYNITDSTTAITGVLGTSVNGVQGSVVRGFLSGIITITDSKTFELQHQCQTSNAVGFGFGNGFGVDDIYSIVKITKVK